MTPIQAYETAKLLGERLPELESCILTSSHYSYFYALDIIKGRWPEAEDVIMESQKMSLLYAVFLIKGRLPEKMHNMMILYVVQDSKDWAAEYFRFLEGTSHRLASWGRPHSAIPCQPAWVLLP